MKQIKWNKYNVLTNNENFIFTINEMYKFPYIKKWYNKLIFIVGCIVYMHYTSKSRYKYLNFIYTVYQKS